MSILPEFLRKKKIDVASLSSDEKATIDNWKRILSDGEVTVDKVVEFCDMQRDLIEGLWQNLDNSKEKNERLIIFHTVYTKISRLIKAPKGEKENLERFLREQIDKG